MEGQALCDSASVKCPKRVTSTARKQVVVFRGAGEGDRGVCARGQGFFGDENVQGLDGGNGCRTRNAVNVPGWCVGTVASRV